MVNPELMGAEQPPPEIPGFQLLELIGEGGTGRVYRAVQLSLQRTVAVKLLTIAPGQQPALAFERESRLMASLAHPNLVTVFDCGQMQGHYYIVTELVRGSTLRPMMPPGEPWATQRVCSVIGRIAQAISYIHDKGVLHLDLKPENILWDEEGGPKITDFGLALTEVDARTLVEMGLTQGTVDYCAPEQRFGLPASERSDLFSLAVLTYELLTGYLPGRVYESARRMNPQLPDQVDGVLRRALARSPEDRFATVEEYRRALTAALRGGAARSRGRTALVLCLVLAALAVGHPRDTPEASPPPSTDPVDSWIVHDAPEQLHWFERDGVGGPGLLTPKPLLVRGRMPSGPGEPPLPRWPSTRPVLVVTSPGTLGFIHPLTGPAFGRRVLSGWGGLARLPPTPAENNFCQGGDFSGNCLTYDSQDDTRPWRIIDPSIQKNGDSLTVADPPDRGGNPALRLVRKDALSQGQEFGCYQWLSRIPERAGTVVVLRYRARAEEGEGRVSVRVQLPLLLPAAAQDETAARLRGLSVPLAELAHRPDEEPRQYRLENWVTPRPEWQTYYTVWEWPPYCHEPGFRNLVVFYAGTGKVWIDDLEIFTWEPGGAP